MNPISILIWLILKFVYKIEQFIFDAMIFDFEKKNNFWTSHKKANVNFIWRQVRFFALSVNSFQTNFSSQIRCVFFQTRLRKWNYMWVRNTSNVSGAQGAKITMFTLIQSPSPTTNPLVFRLVDCLWPFYWSLHKL